MKRFKLDLSPKKIQWGDIVFMFLFGLFMSFGAYIGGLKGVIEVDLLSISDVTTAYITKVDNNTGDVDNPSSPSAHYIYEVDGEWYEGRSIGAIEHDVGDTALIYYSKRNPSKSGLYEVNVVMIFLCLCFVFVIFFVIFVALYRRIKWQRMKNLN